MPSDLEGAEQEVVEEADQPQKRLLRHGLIDDEGEEDGVNSQQRNQCERRLGQPEENEQERERNTFNESMSSACMKKKRRRCLPELVVGVSHLMGLQLGHQNLYYTNEYNEINLFQKERKRERGYNLWD